MNEKPKILIVDDEELNRKILIKILSDEYEVVEAENGREALDLLAQPGHGIAAIVMDLLMPVLDGYGFLQKYMASEELKAIPVLVSTGVHDVASETKCLEFGAWDFIKKPYNSRIIKFRIKNAIERSELYALKEMRYREQYDSLTGLYKKDKFYRVTREMLDNYPDEDFVFVKMDISKFRLVNNFYGMAEGDRLLKYCAQLLIDLEKLFEHITYCHMEADVFCLCCSYPGREAMLKILEDIRQKLNHYKEDYDIVPVFGLYEIENKNLKIYEMNDNANMASEVCKGNYLENYGFYVPEMSQNIHKEQTIVNNMSKALKEEQFVLYLQPKYDLRTNNIDGAEVLVRWNDPERGIVSPGEFLPVFERNGFIMKLDYYVWEHACMLLRQWLDEGKEPIPISVNISRVSLYNPKLVDIICDLVAQYRIPTKLFQLELTESAYTSNPIEIKEAMEELQKRGFYVLMDDFGSGYSSLNVLKDIAVDILKIDMKFLSDTDRVERGENILASVVRMAKWLNMPVIAEGVEKESQVSFLRSIGCEFVQGYYFAKPMPVEDYEALIFGEGSQHTNGSGVERHDAEACWNDNSHMEILFNHMFQPVAIYEFDDDTIDVIRASDAYFELFGYRDINAKGEEFIQSVNEEYREALLHAFRTAAESKGVAECECLRKTEDGREIWVNIKLKYLSGAGKKHMIFGSILDITSQKAMDQELTRYRSALSKADDEYHKLLIVDDMEINRAVLRGIFEDRFQVLEAANGEEALKALADAEYKVDLILLDMVMPVMDGMTFLERRKEQPELSAIPVVVITSENSEEQQVHVLNMGVRDYIIKPFVAEVVNKRILNVLESNRRMREILKVYQDGEETLENDDLKGAYKHWGDREKIENTIARDKRQHALILMSVSNYEKMSEHCGHIISEGAIKIAMEKLSRVLGKEATLNRYEESGFMIFVPGIRDEEDIRRKCELALENMSSIVMQGISLESTIGVAVTTAKCDSLQELISRADKALFTANREGHGRYVLYAE